MSGFLKTGLLQALPSVGSNVTICITRVNLQPNCPFVEFGGSLNHVQLAEELYDKMKQEIQIPKERDCDFEGNPGDLCLVEEDRTWHRARILSKFLNKYNLFLIDDGRTVWVASTVLARGQSTFFNLPPMMELLILASASPLSLENRWSPTALEFLRCLCGKSVSGCLQDVMMPNRIILLDIPVIFKEMQELGFASIRPFEKFKQLVGDYLLSPQENIPLPKSCTLSHVQTKDDCNIQSQYLYPHLLPGIIETVEVMQVVHPLKIFCRLHVFSYELNKLSEQIHEFYEGTPAAVIGRPSCNGSPCAAKGSDGKWYRALLKQNIVSDIVKVFHVDYGMADFVQVENIRPLSSKFFRLPVVTYPCSMFGIMDDGNGWTTGQIDELKTILQNQIFIGKFEQQNSSDGIYFVTLYGNDNVNINNNFAVQERCLYVTEDTVTHCPSGIQLQENFTGYYSTHLQDSHSHEKAVPSGLAQKQTSMKQGSPREKVHEFKPEQSSYHSNGYFVLPEHLFTIGSVVDVNVSYVKNDQIFWCQLADHLASLQTLMHDIQSHYLCSHFQSPTGSVCIVRHPENGLWYRAQIITHHFTSHVEVQLLDYGQSFKVPLQDLRPIDPKFLKLKCQAFQCSIFNKTSSGNLTLSKDDLSRVLRPIDQASFCNILLKCTVCAVMYDSQGKVLNMVHFISQSPSFSNLDPTPFQNKFDNSSGQLLQEPFVQNDKHTTLTSDINIGAKETVRITCVKGVKHFYGQLKQNDHIIENLTKDIQQFCSMVQPNRQQFSPQMMCLARYCDQWHRAQIKSINSKIIVHFVDYGDVLALDKSDVLPVPAMLSSAMSIPFQAVCFELFGVNLEESQELNDWFRSRITDCMFTATIMERNSDGKLSVELNDGKNNINVMMAEKWNDSKTREIFSQRTVSKTLPKDMGYLRGKGHFGEKLQANSNMHQNGRKSGQSQTVIEKDTSNTTANMHENTSKKYEASHSKFIDLPSRCLSTGLVSEVYISHFKSPSNFFIQLATEERDIFVLVDKLNISNTCKLPVDFSKLHLGDLVHAEYSTDGTSYRAVVQNKNKDDTIQVEFIDFGNEATLPISKVWHLGSEFLQFPRYSIHCCLSTCDGKIQTQWTEEQITDFKNAVCEKKLFCHFIKQNSSFWEVNIRDQDITLAEALDTETTVNLICNKPKTLCSQDVCSGQYRKPELSLGQTIEVYASSIVGPDYFWCQYTESAKLDSISLEVQEFGNSTETDSVSMDHLSPGDPCIALYPDDEMWYRAQVISKSANSVSVLFVDYGNESDISYTSVKAVATSQLETPPQAFLCQLDGFKVTHGCWNDSSAAHFFELIVDNPLKVKIQNMEIINNSSLFKYHVQVECKMLIINDIMEDYWNHSVTVCEQKSNDCFLKCTEVEYQQIANPDSFKKNPTSVLNSQEPFDSIKLPFEVTNLLPHGLQQEASDANEVADAKVNGNVNNQSEVKMLLDTSSPNLRKNSNTKDWSDGSSQYLYKVTDLPCITIKQNCTSEVYISHINSSSSFFVQLARDEKSLFLLTEQLNSNCSLVNDQVQLNSKCGSLVKAVFPDDESWYRAVIKDNNGTDEMHVEFIDFGNEVTLSSSNVCKLDEQYLHFPRFSIHCCLQENTVGIQDGIEEGASLLSSVLTMSSEKKFCKFIKETNSTWEVKITDQKSSVEQLSLEKWDEFNEPLMAPPHQECSEVLMLTNMFSFKKPEISPGQIVEVYASSIVGPDYFWCNCANSQKLNEISLIAQEIGNHAETACSKFGQICPRGPCIALFSDNMWYRAQILQKSSNGVSVIFVDYGNVAETKPDSIKPLPDSLMEYPLQAFPCQLEGFNPSEGNWNNNANTKFCELISHKPLKVTIQNITNNLGTLTLLYYVRVHTNEYDVNDQMKNYWTFSEKTFNPDINSVQFHKVSCQEKEVHGVSNDNSVETPPSELSPVLPSNLGHEHEVVFGNEHYNEEPANYKNEKISLSDGEQSNQEKRHLEQVSPKQTTQHNVDVLNVVAESDNSVTNQLNNELYNSDKHLFPMLEEMIPNGNMNEEIVYQPEQGEFKDINNHDDF